MKRLMLVLLFVAIMPAAAWAFTPPALQARVNDYANLLSPEKKAILEAGSKALEGKTTAQVAFLTVPSLQGMTMEDFTLKTFETWKLGQKGKDNGLLIAYSPDGDHYRIEVGYGLEGAIPDGKAGEILRRDLRGHANPKIGTKDFDGAFLAAFTAVATIIETEYGKDPNGLGKKPTNPVLVFLIIVGLIIACVAGIARPVAGAVAGGVCGALCGTLSGLSASWVVALVIMGIILGACVRALLEGCASSGVGGGGGDWSSSSGSDSFSGGGGGGGGGGAGD